MPARPSSQIKHVLGKPVGEVVEALGGAGILAELEKIPDHRKRRGRRYRLSAVLALAVIAVTCDCDSFTAIAQFAANLPAGHLERVGLVRGRYSARIRVPSERCFRHILAAVDPAALLEAVGRFTTHRLEQAGMAKIPARVAKEREARRRARRRRESGGKPAGAGRWSAADGKTLRGSGKDRDTRKHLVALIRHHDGHVLERFSVDAKTTEVPQLREHLRGKDLHGLAVTLDAIHTCTETAKTIVDQGGHYLLSVKANTPRLYARLAAKLTVGDSTTWASRTIEWDQRGHGRIERRTMRVATIEAEDGIDFPHAAQITMTIRRSRPTSGTGKGTKEIAFAITSLTPDECDPVELARAQQGHWSSESRHWILDVTFGEDHCQARAGHEAENLSTIRHCALESIKSAGHANIAHARRDYRDHKDDALKLYEL